MQNRKKQDDPCWFYHSTHTKSEGPAVRPIMSQIPELNGCPDDEFAGPRRRCYENTECVHVAEADRVSDLLNYKEFEKSKDAVGYARNNWFYLEDNALLDARSRDVIAKDTRNDINARYKKDIDWTFGVPPHMSNIQHTRKGCQEDQRTANASIDYNKPILAGGQRSGGLMSEGHKSTNKTVASNRRVSFKNTITPSEQVSSDQPMVSGGHVSEITDNHSRKMSQNNSPNIVEKVVGVAPEPEFRNPILQQEYFKSLPVVYAAEEEDTAVSMSKLLSYSYGRKKTMQRNGMNTGSSRVPCYVTQGPGTQTDNQTTERDNGRSATDFENFKADAASRESLNPVVPVRNPVTQRSRDSEKGT